MKAFFLLLFLMVVGVNMTTAQISEKTWKGTHGSDWNNPNNWDPPGVPGKNHEVDIPEGSPLCHIPDGALSVEAITNWGMLQVGNIHLNVQAFSNYGTMGVSSRLLVSQKRNSESGSYFTSTGKIAAENAVIHIAANHNYQWPMTFNNSGQITANFFSTDVSEFQNNQWSRIDANSIFINASDDILNVAGGTIKAYDGGSIWLKAKELFNRGVVQSGDNKNGRGGSVFVSAKGTIRNNWMGVISGGNGQQRNGDVFLKGKAVESAGRISGGKSGNGSQFQKHSTFEEAIFANITITADSLFIHPADSTIEADTLTLRGNYIQLYDFNNYSTIYVDNVVLFQSTVGGIIDFSGVHTQGAISGGLNFASIIYCDNIIAPTEGLNHIFDLGVDVFPAEETVLGTQVDIWDQFGVSGTSNAFEVLIQNQSLTSNVINYRISSKKGWLPFMAGSTAMLAPFNFDSVQVAYSIPAGLETGVTDTVIVMFSNEQGVDTTYSIIHCFGSLPSVSSLAIISDSLKTGVAGEFYLDSLDADWGKPPYRWSTSDLLPAGLDLDSLSGWISGTPSIAGSDTLVVVVKDSENPQGNATKEVTVTILPAAISRIEVSPDSISLEPGQSQQFAATGYDPFDNEVFFNPAWSSTGGTIDVNGLYTAGDQPGIYKVFAKNLSSEVSDSVVVTITTATDVSTTELLIPERFQLFQNYPNPFNPSTNIRFDVAKTTSVEIKLYDINGRLIEILVNEERLPGSYEVVVDATRLASGLYFYHGRMGVYNSVRKMLVLK